MHTNTETPPCHHQLLLFQVVVVRAAAPTKPSVPAAPIEIPDDPEALKAQIVEAEAQYVLQTYARPPDLVLTHGVGCKMYDISGKEYLDFAAGIAVNALGHSDPVWLATLTEQASRLAHTSNLFHTVPQVQLAERLCTTSFADKAFFCNSGTEANEACIKFARKFARLQAGVDAQDAEAAAPTGLVAFTGSFHGRTMGALALTAKTQYQTPFLPIMPGVTQVRCFPPPPPASAFHREGFSGSALWQAACRPNSSI